MSIKSEFKVITNVSKRVENLDGDTVAEFYSGDSEPLYLSSYAAMSYSEESFKQLIAVIKKMTGWKL